MTDPQEAAITAATEAWRGRLSSLADPIQFLEHVEASQLAAGLTYKGSAVMPVAEPVFLTESEHEGDRRAVDAVLAALVAAGERVFADPVLRPRFLGDFSGDGVSAELVNLPTGYDLPIVFGRLDGMRVGTGLQFLEFNGGLPGGVTPTDLSAELMASWGVAQDFRDSIPFRTMTTAPAVMDALVATWHSYGGSGRPYTVLALPHELEEIAAPAVAYLRRAAAAADIEFAVSDPADLHHAGARLRRGDRAVDVLLRGFFTTMVDYLASRLDGIIAALRAGDVCMVTSMRSGMYGYKSLFAAITDESFELDLPSDVLRIARSHLPWTRLVEPGTCTTPDGDRVDLASYITANREHLVLKPAAGYGGSDVQLGWQHTDDSWQAQLQTALHTGGHVVQRAVESPQNEFATLAPGFPVMAFTTDHNPIITGNTIAGYYVRVTPGAGLTNVTAGAGVAPTFVVNG
ncbi:MAG: hypothetical protein KDC23_02340 [Actinobacteria bacterium]|nr:hypothetical protein [Actinomycetota bacterium]